jgi:formylglycine-generating enzyme required for sulfatase activity
VVVTATIADGKAAGTPYTQDFSITIDPFVAVTGITGVPASATAGTDHSLTGTVEPGNATNRTILWSVKDPGTTGAAVSGDTLSTTGAGTVVVTAAISGGKAEGTPYTRDFNITIDPFVAVSGIMGVPASTDGKIYFRDIVTIAPPNATNQAIVWTVKTAGATGAAIGFHTAKGDYLTTTGEGPVVVTATIAGGTAPGTDYTQDFSIVVSPSPSSITYTLKPVPAGTVTADIGESGGPFCDAGTPPVSVSAFSIGETEISYELWRAVYDRATTSALGVSKYIFANAGREGNDGTDGAAPTTAARQEPVTMISWRDAVVWCNAYSEAMGKTAVYKYNGMILKESEDASVPAGSGKAEQAVIDPIANGYRLPTEAEWEYAARGGVPGTGTPWTYIYAGSDTADDVAVHSGNSGSKTAFVKTKAANSLGLYDMSGNVYEWCQDPFSGSGRIQKGGAWNKAASFCNVSIRLTSSPSSAEPGVGFRVVGP